MYRIFLFLLLVVAFFSSCSNRSRNPNLHLQLSDFEALNTSDYALNSHRIHHYLEQVALSDTETTGVDGRAKSYYLHGGEFIWVSRQGVNHQADTLLAYLQRVDELGFSKSRFRVSQIEADLRRFHLLDFDKGEHAINKVLGRLEYNLTKAYLRYTIVQSFGLVNPSRLLNKLDRNERDTVRVSYRGLFDIPMKTVGKQFCKEALAKIAHDSVGSFLHEIQPKSELYSQLKGLLAVTTDKMIRSRILCNMERCRWRYYDEPSKHEKYVLVNIPSFHLRAVNGREVLEMKIGCGTTETKTPLLTSRIMRMDINPQWVIPRSITEKNIANHFGDRQYFDSHRYFVRDRKTGQKVPFDRITQDMFHSKDYLVIQKGGIGNSLGRIIFRFNNSFSVFLHDTNRHNVFSQENRGVSHGCIRVERPFDLAVFLLKDKNESLIRKLHYSMTAEIGGESTVLPEEEKKMIRKQKPDTLQRSMLISSLKVEPQIPIFITYFTIYPDVNGKLQYFSDVYGYDKVIFDALKSFGVK